jgi:fatty-acyl-CoA synthase
MPLLKALMQDRQLLISSLIKYSAEYHGENEIVTRNNDGTIHRTNYGEVYKRTQKLAHALESIGAEPGDRIGTISWNSFRHLEVYDIVPIRSPGSAPIDSNACASFCVLL